MPTHRDSVGADPKGIIIEAIGALQTCVQGRYILQQRGVTNVAVLKIAKEHTTIRVVLISAAVTESKIKS